MGKDNKKEEKKKEVANLSQYFCAHLEDTESFIYERQNNRKLARLLVSDIVPLQENQKFVVTVIYRYANYLKGARGMEVKSNKIIDVQLEKGIATLFDKRTGQSLAQLRYNPAISPMDTMAFISAVAADYERYLKLIAKYYGGWLSNYQFKALF